MEKGNEVPAENVLCSPFDPVPSSRGSQPHTSPPHSSSSASSLFSTNIPQTTWGLKRGKDGRKSLFPVQLHWKRVSCSQTGLEGPCLSKALTQNQNHRLKIHIEVTGSENWFFYWGHNSCRRMLIASQKLYNPVSNVPRCLGKRAWIPVKYQHSEPWRSWVLFLTLWAGLLVHSTRLLPQALSGELQPHWWFLSRAVRTLQLHCQVPLRSVVPPDIPPTEWPSLKRTLGSWSTTASRYLLPQFFLNSGVLISDKAPWSHCNINYSVKISQMGWAKSLTLFLRCKKPGGASASLAVARQESNSSLSLNSQSFIPGHRAKKSHPSNSLPTVGTCGYFSAACNVVSFAQVMLHWAAGTNLGGERAAYTWGCSKKHLFSGRGPEEALGLEDTLVCLFLSF